MYRLKAPVGATDISPGREPGDQDVLGNKPRQGRQKYTKLQRRFFRPSGTGFTYYRNPRADARGYVLPHLTVLQGNSFSTELYEFYSLIPESDECQ